MIKFPYYSGNIYKSEVIGLISLPNFIKKHKNPDKKTLKLLKKIQEARDNNQTNLKRYYKTKLPAFTPSVILDIGDTREYANIKGFTGLMQIDLDKIPTVQEAIDLKEHLFHEHEEIVCSYLSPSRNGVKCLMKVRVANDVEQFKHIHKSVKKEFKKYGYFDSATKNAILPLFLSNDEDILFREFEYCDRWIDEDRSQPQYLQMNEAPIVTRRNKDVNYEKTVRIVTKRINEIVDNGHPQVVSASLILGSRVGANYITEMEARSLIENLISNNSYLQKDVKGYVRTAMWGIGQGMLNPKYY